MAIKVSEIYPCLRNKIQGDLDLLDNGFIPDNYSETENGQSLSYSLTYKGMGLLVTVPIIHETFNSSMVIERMELEGFSDKSQEAMVKWVLPRFINYELKYAPKPMILHWETSDSEEILNVVSIEGIEITYS